MGSGQTGLAAPKARSSSQLTELLLDSILKCLRPGGVQLPLAGTQPKVPDLSIT